MTSRDSAASEITPEVLLRAYACGIFPMAVDKRGRIGWFSPDPRAKPWRKQPRSFSDATKEDL